MSAPPLPILTKLHEEGLGYGIGPALVCQEAEQLITELYEALSDLLCYHDVPGPVDAPLKPLMDAAFAALAKARGE